MVIISGLSMVIFAIIFVRARGGNPLGTASKESKSAGILSDNGTMVVAKYLVWYPVGE